DNIKRILKSLEGSRRAAAECLDLGAVRGVEGNAANAYFSVFSEGILQHKSIFNFGGRSRRPPLDPVNALLSLAYTLLATEAAASLAGVGLDSYVGFLHRERPGRNSLALDIMEEMRPIIADRFVLKIINRKQIGEKDFIVKENNAVMLTDEARRNFFQLWQKEK